MITDYGLGNCRALLLVYYPYGQAPVAPYPFVDILTNRDSASVRFNTPFHGRGWRPPFELVSLNISDGKPPPLLLCPSAHPLNFTFRLWGVFHILPLAWICSLVPRGFLVSCRGRCRIHIKLSHRSRNNLHRYRVLRGTPYVS